MSTSPPFPIPPAAASPLGAHVVRQADGSIAGVNFAVWAPAASAVWVCLFEGAAEQSRLALQPAGNGVWAVLAPPVRPGQLYGLRADGPWQPQAGHRFNPAKLLLDPWAKALADPSGQAFAHLSLQTGHMAGATHSTEWSAHQPDPRDNAAHVPRCVVLDEPLSPPAPPPVPGWCLPDDRVVLYEAHVKALTQQHPALPAHLRGTYAGLAHPAVVDHLRQLGVTTLCLMPVHAHITERHLLARGLTNHWGYNTLNVFTPEHRYAACTGGQPPRDAAEAAAVRDEFRNMVNSLHAAGLEVVLDVVFNHTCESDLDGPTLSWRGLGQTDWYSMADHGVPHNFSGCGNSLNISQPRVLQWVMDSLRWWVQVHGVDGFRFDLAVSLGRDAALGHRFTPHHALLAAMAQDPVLASVRRIAEPWDIGPDGHHTGGFAPGWSEWNDGFRDTVRAYWLGHPCTRGELAHAVCASAGRFAHATAHRHHGQRPPTASLHFLTAHDGFTLHDLTAYHDRHNHANGEDNRDGHGHNLSTNAGTEGPTTDAAVLHRRGLLQRALLATLFCAQGTPQLLAGDELGHTQSGNNNAYCQDNPTTWLRWTDPTPLDALVADATQRASGTDTHLHRHALSRFIAQLTALRRELPALRHGAWFSGTPLQGAAHPDIAWLDTDGLPMSASAWNDHGHRTLQAVVTVGEPRQVARERVLIIWHASHADVTCTLPPGNWVWRLDSSRPDHAATTRSGWLNLAEPAVCLLVQALSAPDAPPAA
ncbi:MAG TPA: glycogen debranching protein GlgX [Burkholderiaceae bacterium]|nr:glycogen debranching protein GlgX [Burkholderiaceae bacterium]